MKTSFFLTLFFFISHIVIGQTLQIEWQQCFGGSDTDVGVSLIKKSDGSLVLLALSGSDNGDVSFNYGKADWWLVKTDSSGTLIWEKTFGGTDDDDPNKIMVSPDGGYVLFGETFSNDGDVSGNHGGLDYWLVKTDSIGNIIWQRCIGSGVNDYASDMKMDSAGNIYVIGFTHGTDGDISSNNGHADYWFVKVSPAGNILWDKNLGGSWPDWGKCLALTQDGGMIVGGLTESNDKDVSCNETLGQVQAWVVKLDSLNNIEWQKCYGGSYTENVIRIEQTDDKGYILLCLTNSNDGDVTGFHGQPGTPYNFDIWVVKLDSVGNMEWQRCLGGTDNESPRFIKVTEDGSYLVGGITYSNNGDVSGNHSVTDRFDFWLVKLSSTGEIIWQQCFGGEWNDNFYDLLVLSNDRFLLLGSTTTFNNTGDVNCDYKGQGDMWLFEVKDTTVGINETTPDNATVKVYPNPAGNYVIFEITGKAAGKLSTEITIKNILGQTVKTIRAAEGRPLTNNKVVWDTRSIKNGVYLYTLNVAGSVKSGKIVVSK